MGTRETHLREIVKSKKYTVIDESSDRELRNALITSSYNEEIAEIYKSECTNQARDKGLGGVLDDYPRGFKKWDISARDILTEGRFHIELDEEQHFNRYRRITLMSCFYQKENVFSPEQLGQYKQFCEKFEGRCRHDGKFWSNPSADEQFGMASPRGDFSGNGSSRWKQRAFYDFLKDITQLTEKTPLIRISIYDTICINGDERLVGDLLESDQYMDYAPEILALIEKRLEWRRK